MDPITLILIGVCASGAAAALGLRGRRKDPTEPERKLPASRGRDGARANRTASDEVRVGDVLLYLGDEFWLAGALSIMREGATALRVFTAPDRGRDRFVAIPSDGRSVWLMFADDELGAIGWPGVEVPSAGRMLRRAEYGPAAISQEGEGLTNWEGTGRFAVFRAHDGIAVVIEGPARQRLALTGREIPRQLIEKMG